MIQLLQTIKSYTNRLKGLLLIQYSDYLLVVALIIYWGGIVIKNGINLSPDSCHYLSFAVDMHFENEFNTVITKWPPLTPFIIHCLMFLSPYPTQAAALMSLLFLGLSLVGFVYLLRSLFLPIIIRLLLIVSLFLTYKWLHIFSYAWSEIPFAGFTILFFIGMLIYERSKGNSILILMAASVSLILLSRYTGYSMGVIFALYLFYDFYRGIKDSNKQKQVSQRNLKKNDTQKHSYCLPLYWFKSIGLQKLLIYLVSVLICLIPIGSYLLRNYIQSETLHGPRLPSDLSFLHNTWITIKTFINLYPIFLFLLGLSLILLFIAYYDRIIKHRKRYNDSNLTITFFMLLFIGLYLFMMIYAASTIKMDNICLRYISFLFPLLYLIIGYGMKILIDLNNRDIQPCIYKTIKQKNGEKSWSSLLKRILDKTINNISVISMGWVILLLFLIYSIGPSYYQFIERVTLQGNEVLGHLEAGFRQSQTAQGIRDYIMTEANTQQELLFSGIYDEKIVRLHPILPHVLFFNDILFKDTSEYRILSHSLDGYDLQFKVGGELKLIHYRKVGAYRNPSDFRGILSKMQSIAKETSCEQFYLFIGNTIFDEYFSRDASFIELRGNGRLLQQKIIEPYIFLTITAASMD